MSQNFGLLQVSNLFVQNFRSFLLMYPGSLTLCPEIEHRTRNRATEHTNTDHVLGTQTHTQGNDTLARVFSIRHDLGEGAQSMTGGDLKKNSAVSDDAKE